MSNIEIKNKNKYNNLNFIKQLSVKEILEIDGYVRYNCDISASEEDIKIIEKEFNNLKRDKYALENTQRHRAYSNAIILPWLNNKIVWLPVIIEEGEELSIYDQGNNNPEHTEVRYFNAISQESKDTKLLNDLIISDFKNTIGLNMSSPIFVGVHFVNTFCDNSKRQGVASPDTLHQDGEPFTFAHLVSVAMIMLMVE
ncbi:2OG-Fe dioxygenase family protein [Photobacterium leiognathi]|uniref:2OG-Fe dioxygenase family protein n=1 Tax=Photobacterium leiognathi TaxID=553611 RepID=UPI002739EF6F|nr:2OG-Fe dioxygenase family protein [Photobacterium leiognathi]